MLWHLKELSSKKDKFWGFKSERSVLSLVVVQAAFKLRRQNLFLERQIALTKSFKLKMHLDETM
jgi:hypothetical protein